MSTVTLTKVIKNTNKYVMLFFIALIVFIDLTKSTRCEEHNLVLHLGEDFRSGLKVSRLKNTLHFQKLITKKTKTIQQKFEQPLTSVKTVVLKLFLQIVREFSKFNKY